MNEDLFMKNQLTWRRRFSALAAFALVIAPGVAAAHSYKLGDIAVGHIWAAPPESTESIAVYGPILNQGDTGSQLTGATTPVAEEVRIRVATEGNERWIDTLELEPGKPVALAPWRQHLWLTGLKRKLKEGDSFELILEFGRAGNLAVQVEIEPEGGH
jgi:copper(I)-binding protein